MDFDAYLVAPTRTVGLDLSPGATSLASVLDPGFKIQDLGPQMIFVTPYGAYRVGDPFAAGGKTVFSIQKFEGVSFYLVVIATGGAPPVLGGGAFDFSDPANLAQLVAL